MNKRTILIVKEEKEPVNQVDKFLINEGLDVTICNDIFIALAEARRPKYQIILLELTRLNSSGFNLLKRLREISVTPLILIAQYYDFCEKVYSLELGADEYLVKPIHSRELIARMNVFFRRHDNTESTAHSLLSTINDITICNSTMTVMSEKGSINLTLCEFEVLNILMINAGKVISKEQIFEFVHSRTMSYNDRSIEMHISKIKKKIRLLVEGEKIKTVRSRGYVFLSG